MKNIKSLLLSLSILNLGTSRQWKELQTIILSRLIHEWDAWEIPRNFFG